MKIHIIDKLEAELLRLEKELTQKIPQELSRAAAFGDLSDNAEYEAVKNRQKFVEARLAQIQDRLRSLAALDLEALPRDRVAFGSIVHLRDLNSHEIKIYRIVTAEEVGKIPGQITASSPVGKAINGKKVGEEIELNLPAGIKNLKIEKIITIHDQEE